MPNRWVFVSRAVSTDADVEFIRGIARTAGEHGLTGILWSGSFDNLTRQNEAFHRRVVAVRQIAEENGLELIPLFVSPGYAGGLLSYNRNLAEGLPVRDALFVVSGNYARLTPDPQVEFVNGGFERYSGDRVEGMRLQDAPGELSFVDTSVMHDGSASVRFENLNRAPAGNARIMQEISVVPHRSYRVSAWVRTEGIAPASGFRLQVLGTDSRAMAPWDAKVPATTNWRKLTFGFNSMDRDRVRIYAGMWGARAGKFWVDDITVEEVGLLNIVRREGTPLRVVSEADGTEYEEGRDFQPIRDGLINFRWDHEPPIIRLLAESRIKDGERLRVSFYHGMAVNDGQVSACMSEPEVLDIVARNTRLIHELLAPRKYLLSIDEIRAGGSCDACKRRGLSMGQILGDFITRAFMIVKEVNPDAEVFAWSDMLDPNHNARSDYYLVDGTYDGSWWWVPGDLNIVTWYYSKRKESLQHFSSLGFRTLAGAYYDGDDLENVKGWLRALDATQGAIGIMYTTWENKYGLLPDFGDLVSGRTAP